MLARAAMLRRSGQPARAAGDDHLPGGELGRGSAAPRQTLAHPICDQARRRADRRAARNADVDRVHLAGEALARIDPQSRLGGVKGHGHSRAHGCAGDHAGGRIDAARNVHGDDGSRRVVERGDRRRDRPVRLSGKPRAEQRVDDHRRAGDRAGSLLERDRRLTRKPVEVGASVAGELVERGRDR